MISNVFFFFNHAIYEIMWKNIVELGRPVDKMAHAHWMLDIKGYIYTHSEYVLLTTFFHCNNGCMNAPQYYIMCTLPVFLCPVKI